MPVGSHVFPLALRPVTGVDVHLPAKGAVELVHRSDSDITYDCCLDIASIDGAVGTKLKRL